MNGLADLRPTRNEKVFDLVERAGHDMTDWKESSNDPRGYKANPKYCFNWSFAQEAGPVVLNLWHANMEEDSNGIRHIANYRKDAEENSLTGKAEWVRRGFNLDSALQLAARDGRPIRVIVLEGQRRSSSDPQLRSSRVTARSLDTATWRIHRYDWATGEFELRREHPGQAYVDQFDLSPDLAEPVAGRSKQTIIYPRNPAVRRSVLVGASGNCELCGVAGFRTVSGARYLETHHIVPLCEGGHDTVANVIALCPGDHRRAHYGTDVVELRVALLAIVARRTLHLVA